MYGGRSGTLGNEGTRSPGRQNSCKIPGTLMPSLKDPKKIM